ncbi:MAG TPA: pseudouridine synthase [Acidimicrobiia bacterium]|nr:pseudouridine synthase [Acidimicrobiia bacterium]
MAERVRIQKAIANSGLMSRRAAEEAMSEGRVRLNGRSVVLGDRVDPDNDILTVDGAPIPISEELETHLLYKPVGVISTADDPQNRQTVVDLIRSSRRLYPVGRLDADSEGLILVSNDGELTHRITHPSFGITKTYLAEIHGIPSREALRRLTNGVQLEDGPAAALSVRLVDSHEQRSLVELTMVEGRNREVRRMFDVIGHEVARLVRTAIGGLVDTTLRPGESRLLTVAEIHDLLET